MIALCQLPYNHREYYLDTAFAVIFRFEHLTRDRYRSKRRLVYLPVGKHIEKVMSEALAQTKSTDTEQHCVRQRILDAARRAFTSKGYAGASLRAIASSAGVTKPMVYYYFGSKDGLYQTLLDSSFDALRAAFVELDKSNAPTREKLGDLLYFHMRAATEDSETIRFFLSAILSAKHRLAQCMGQNAQDFQQGYLRSLLEGARERGEIRCENLESLIYALQGTFSRAYELSLQNSPLPSNSRAFAQETIDLFFNGIKPA